MSRSEPRWSRGEAERGREQGGAEVSRGEQPGGAVGLLVVEVVGLDAQLAQRARREQVAHARDDRPAKAAHDDPVPALESAVGEDHLRGHTPRTCRGRVVDVSACRRGTPKDMSRTCRGRVVGVSAPRPVCEGHVGGRAEPLDHLDLEHGALHHRRPPVRTCPGRVPDVSRRWARHFAIGVHMMRSTNIFCVMPTRFIRMSATPSPV